MISPRERQIARLISQGKTNKEIAVELHLHETTVKTYLFILFKKAEVSNRTELAIKYERGFLLPPNADEELTLA